MGPAPTGPRPRRSSQRKEGNYERRPYSPPAPSGARARNPSSGHAPASGAHPAARAGRRRGPHRRNTLAAGHQSTPHGASDAKHALTRLDAPGHHLRAWGAPPPDPDSGHHRSDDWSECQAERAADGAGAAEARSRGAEETSYRHNSDPTRAAACPECDAAREAEYA